MYQDAGDSRVDRIERDGTRTVGRFVNRRFVADEPTDAIARALFPDFPEEAAYEAARAADAVRTDLLHRGVSFAPDEAPGIAYTWLAVDQGRDA